MSREITKDFASLVEFFKGYTLHSQSSNPDLIKILSQQHKKLYSYLTCIAELNQLSNDVSITPTISTEQLAFLTESSSDIGIALFVMTHGAYKASKMMLRSSIETFNKGFNLDWIPDIEKEKSIFTMFERIKSIPFFVSGPPKKINTAIHQHYKILCQDTHTADIANMQHVTALKYFPTFNLADATKVSAISMKLVSSYITLICIKYNNHFHKMHHRNKENILENIPKEFKPLIHGIV